MLVRIVLQIGMTLYGALTFTNLVSNGQRQTVQLLLPEYCYVII